MCGIAGYFGKPRGPVPGRLILQAMVAAIAHRGPDEQGVHVDDDIGLGHARLSIIDLAGGGQPMANEDGTLHVTFNGEIFNYVELRRDLIARGHRMATRSDTEVILHLYEEMGPECVRAFNGDFAFALWDSRNRRLVLARDRMGVRPLFYARRGDCLYFASEIKALLQATDISAELDPIALDQTFTFWFPLAPRTAFKNIHELPPAHILIAEPGRTTVRSYWSLDFPAADEDTDHREERQLAEDLRTLLVDATRLRLRSDVPVGSYLSGGLDSSIVTSIARSIVPDQLRTFSVTFDSEEFDESRYQQEMVAALGTEHCTVACTDGEIGRAFPEVIRHTERPILRTSPAPLHALSRLVRDRGYKVVLTGEGADEVFAGYDIFKEAKVRRFCAAQPGSPSRLRLLQRLYPYLPGLRSQTPGYLASFFATAGTEMTDPLFSHLPRFRTTAGAKIFYSAAMREAVGDYDALADLRGSLPAAFASWHPLHQAQYLETVHLLPGYILSSQGDRMAMAHGVEGRFPFLDHRLVEFASRIPPNLKLKVLREKHILREATADLVPPAIANRPKQPYRAPDSQSFAGATPPEYVTECLAADSIARSGLFDPDAVGKLAAKCRSRPFIGFRDNMAMVGVLSTQLWHRSFIDGFASNTSNLRRRAATA